MQNTTRGIDNIFAMAACRLGLRPCGKAVYLKGLIESVVSHGDSSVWSLNARAE